ncbi:rap guanine nucleotide exchange factor 1-like isoform X1 [Styela clava]
MAENREKREATGSQDATKRMAKKLRTAKQKLTESFKSAALKEFYREKYKNNRRINKSYERNHKLHRRHSPAASSLEDLFRPGSDDGSFDGNKQDDAEQKLKNLCKDVKLSLLYFEAIVLKNITEQYAGSATKILETIMGIFDQLSHGNFSPEQSSVLMSCRSRLVQSLAQLIHWSDTTLLHTAKTHEKTPIRDTIQSVQSAVEDLVEESIKKIQTQTNNSAPVTPMKALKPPWPSLSENQTDDFTSAPPKPPLPTDRNNKTPPLPPKSRNSGSKPVGIVAPFNMNPDINFANTSNSIFGVAGLTRSEESLLEQNYKFAQETDMKNGSLHRGEPDRSSMCSSNFGSDTFDECNSEAMFEADRIMRRSLPKEKKVIYDDDGDYEQLREDSTVNGGKSRPLSDPSVLLPIRLSLADENEIIGSRDDWASLLQGRRASASVPGLDNLSNSENPPALPAKQRQSLLNKHLSDASQLSMGSIDSMEMTSSSQDDDDDKPPPLPMKQKTIQAYMQMFSEAQPPPMAEIARQTAKRYQFPVINNNGTYEVTPQHGPMKAYQLPYDSQSQYSSSSMGRHRDSLTSLSSITSDISTASFPGVTQTPPALPPKARRSTNESLPMSSPLSTRSPSVSSEQGSIDIPEKEPPLPVKIRPMLLPDKLTSKSFKTSETRRSTRDKDNSHDLKAITDPGDLMDKTDVLEWIVFKTKRSETKDDVKEIKAGVADALIVYAAEASKKNLLYYEAFLTTYRTFMTPMELLQKLLYRYKKFGKESTEEKRDHQRASRNAFFLLLRVVDELSLVDIQDNVLNLLMELVYQLLCDGNLTLAKLLRTKVLFKHEHRMSNIVDNILTPLSSLNISSKVTTVADFSSERIAEQMTLLDLELFQKIEIPEVLQWAKEQSEELSPHLTAFTEHFNKMSFWTRTIILKQDKPQDREKLLNKFIRIMRHLRRLNNFNSYLAILSALDSAPVRRLEWQKQTTEGLREYCQLIDSSSSFRTYREALAEAPLPCIPYLGLILQDLTFIHLGNQDELHPGLINFSKRWQQFTILDSMRRFKQSVYPFDKDQHVVDMFDNFSSHLAEDALWEISLKIKPRVRRPRRPHMSTDTSVSRPDSTVTTDSTSTQDATIS